MLRLKRVNWSAAFDYARQLPWYLFVLAAAVTATLVFLVVDRREPSANSMQLVAVQELSAYRIMADFSAAFWVARRVGNGTSGIPFSTARLPLQSLVDRIEHLEGPEIRSFLESRGLEDERGQVAAFGQGLKAVLRAAPEDMPENFLVQMRDIRRPLITVSDAIGAGENEIVGTMNRELIASRAKLIAAAVFVSLIALSFFVAIWSRNRSLLAKKTELEASEAKLRELSFYRQQFLANMSHEFRTPLNAIQGFSDAILHQREHMSEEMVTEYIGIVSQSARDLTRITEDVLDLSKIDAGKYEIDFEDVDLCRLIDDTVLQFGAAAVQHDVEIETELASNWLIQCDRMAIKRCITNVLSNAVKFSDPGDTVRIATRMRDSKVFVIEVRDQGCGIPEKDLNSIWMVYARASMTRKSRREGAGLGLAMVKALMDAHNGFVEVQSREGVGTSVRLCFPSSMIVAARPEEIKRSPTLRQNVSSLPAVAPVPVAESRALHLFSATCA